MSFSAIPSHHIMGISLTEAVYAVGLYSHEVCMLGSTWVVVAGPCVFRVLSIHVMFYICYRFYFVANPLRGYEGLAYFLCAI